MSDLKITYPTKIYCSHEYPFAYATLTDFGDGKGLLQIYSDWGNYASFWGAIGKDNTIADFLLSCSSDYIENNLSSSIAQSRLKKDGYGRLTKFMAHCWPRLRKLIANENQNQQGG